MGRDLRRRILRRYGTAQNVRRLARRGDLDAREALSDLALLKEAPHQLNMELICSRHVRLDAEAFDRLTKERVRIMEFLAGAKDPPTLTTIMDALKRDKKNVSTDLRVLEALGLVRIARVGREIRPRLAGNEIVIRFQAT